MGPFRSLNFRLDEKSNRDLPYIVPSTKTQQLVFVELVHAAIVQCLGLLTTCSLNLQENSSIRTACILLKQPFIHDTAHAIAPQLVDKCVNMREGRSRVDAATDEFTDCGTHQSEPIAHPWMHPIWRPGLRDSKYVSCSLD